MGKNIEKKNKTKNKEPITDIDEKKYIMLKAFDNFFCINFFFHNL